MYQGVVHEVHGPHAVRFGGNFQGLFDACRKAFFRPAWQVEPVRAIDAPDSFVIPWMAFVAQQVVTFPEALSPMLFEQCVEGFQDGGVTSSLIHCFAIPCGTAEAYCCAASFDGEFFGLL